TARIRGTPASARAAAAVRLSGPAHQNETNSAATAGDSPLRARRLDRDTLRRKSQTLRRSSQLSASESAEIREACRISACHSWYGTRYRYRCSFRSPKPPATGDGAGPIGAAHHAVPRAGRRAGPGGAGGSRRSPTSNTLDD